VDDVKTAHETCTRAGLSGATPRPGEEQSTQSGGIVDFSARWMSSSGASRRPGRRQAAVTESRSSSGGESTRPRPTDQGHGRQQATRRCRRTEQVGADEADAAAKRDDVKMAIDKRNRQLDARSPPARRAGPKPRRPTPSTSPTGRSTTRSWPCWTPSTPAPTPTNAPRRWASPGLTGRRRTAPQ
jgi:hypothetical protein